MMLSLPGPGPFSTCVSLAKELNHTDEKLLKGMPAEMRKFVVHVVQKFSLHGH